MNNKRVLVLRTSEPDGTSYAGFKWPKRGPVKAPDWNPRPKCGHGLHGLLWGVGDCDLLRWDRGACWQVVSVLEREIVEIDDDKVKFPRGNVIYTGTRKGATDYIRAHVPRDVAVAAAIAVGDNGKTIRVGDGGIAAVGCDGTAIAGNQGYAVADSRGVATAGAFGQALAGHFGVASVGRGGVAIVGTGGKAKGGPGATLIFPCCGMSRIFHVGVDGILPDMFYSVVPGKKEPVAEVSFVYTAPAATNPEPPRPRRQTTQRTKRVAAPETK